MVVFEKRDTVEYRRAARSSYTFFFLLFSFLFGVNKKPRLLADSGVNVKARLLFSAYDSP